MSRIYVGGAGGAPSNNVLRSLRESGADHLIGGSSSAAGLLLADVDERYMVPLARDPKYPEIVLDLLDRVRPDLMHVQNDAEVLAVSRLRDDITGQGTRLFLPSASAVELFVDKWSSYQVWCAARLPVPTTFFLSGPADLKVAFEKLGGRVWLRATTGGGGRGALPTDDPVLANRWIDRFEGWGAFTASEVLSSESVTWLSVWKNGRLAAAQTRRRMGWGFGDRTLSGVTGVTALAETWSSAEVNELAIAAISAGEEVPHGIYGVDMTYDDAGQLRLTEINVGRFFTTVYFFTKAGYNFPRLYVDLALNRVDVPDSPVLDPLENGLLWVREMDREPLLTKTVELERLERGESWLAQSL